MRYEKVRNYTFIGVFVIFAIMGVAGVGMNVVAALQALGVV